jgi:signal transduction histidine kinase
MHQGSLKLRLFSAAAAVITVALLLAGFTFYFLFERYVEKLTAFEMNNHFLQLAAKISRDVNGEIIVSSLLSDPRFQKPYGGLYWQIDVAHKLPLRSRSLWDDQLTLSTATESKLPLFRVAEGPHNKTLLITEHFVSVENTDGSEQPLRVAIAIDRDQIASAVTGFSKDLMLGLGALYAVLLLGSLIQISVGIKPLESLRNAIADIRKGKTGVIKTHFPKEVQPLVDEVNALLTARDQQLIRARERASNMAHGLKTPLTVMTAVAETLAGSGQKSNADIIHRSAQQMNDLVERELARARMASGHAPRLVQLLPVVSRIVESLQRTTHKQALTWQIDIKSADQMSIEAGDLIELLGNLLDNAQKWADTTIRVSFENDVLAIEDDGPGVAEAQISVIENRGVKLDESKAGSGLGLAIVRDIAEINNMTLRLGNSALGGLNATISPNQSRAFT